MDVEDNPETWGYHLKEHWKSFSDGCDRYWKVFSFICDEWNKEGHKNKIDRLTWREYVLWDMMRRHQEEVNAAQSKADSKL